MILLDVGQILMDFGQMFRTMVKMTTHGFDKPLDKPDGRRNLEPTIPPGDKVPPRMRTFGAPPYTERGNKAGKGLRINSRGCGTHVVSLWLLHVADFN